MAISAAVQTSSAAFLFGILLQAATGALFIYFKGHGSTIFKDGRRLVLVLFLLFAALWAQIDFLNLLITAGHPTICQATLIFSTAFDQFARFTLEQFLLWSVGQGTKATAGQLILQAVLGVRLIAGGILVGFTRPDFAPVCIARTSVEPVGIVVVALDFALIGMLLVRSVSSGIFRYGTDSRSRTRDQSKGLIFVVVGFIVWTATSVPMMLGIPTIFLIVRTVVPANGLLILVGILTFSSGSLLEVREEITTPEAHSPFVAPSLQVQTRDVFRENVVNNGSPIVGHNYTKSGSLFVVNPSLTPRDSPTAGQSYFQSNPQGFSKLGGETTVTDLGPSNDDQPTSKNIPGYRGSSGVFPAILSRSMSYDQAALAPQIRQNFIDNTRNVPLPAVPAPTVQQKRSLFNRQKQPAKPNIRSLAISKPVMNEEESSNLQPFPRIQTIDLAQAAVTERERREAAADRSRLIANRPAPRPPQQFTFPAQEGLRQSISVKRKEMPSRTREPMPTITSSGSSGLSVDAANGSTTSASLSPGREEVRRRSPRNEKTFGGSIDEQERQLPSFQINQTNGLPSNPRATRIAPAPHVGKEQTVMFMNDIVYDNPGVVKSLIKEAPQMYAAAKKAKAPEKSPPDSYTTDLKSSGSIIHRPRPFRRKSDAERSFFASESTPSPRHRRSKSGSSITTRKSLLMSYPGSPTQLPPLPPPPTSASRLKRLLPNDTKSMTFDEKIQLLFPAPPGVSVLHNRRSSVPSLPRVPSVFMSETPTTQRPTQEQRSQRASKRTTIGSFGMADVPAQVLNDDSSYGPDQTYRFSANTYRTLADQVGETWIPGIPVKEVNFGSMAPDLMDMDPHISQNMRKSHITETSSSFMIIDDDSTTYWGSIHSEIPPVDLRTVMRNANSTFIQRSRAGTLEEIKPALQAEEPQHGEEIMTVMLGYEEGCKSTLTSGDNRQSFFLDADQALPGDKTPTTTWHRRIGDELLTFSERKAKTRSRKMPPPTPLLLNQRGRGATVVVRVAEPSPPVMDSPEKAIAEIEAQLKRFEESGRGSLGSLLRNIPEAGNAVNKDHDDRFRLLENLENEIGQQENQWQKMQTNLDRDSLSSLMTPQAPRQSASETSRESSQRSSRPPSRTVSRRARIRSSMTLRSKGDESTLSMSTQSSDNHRASIWQQRLAEAQMEYMENAPDLLRKRSLNFLSVSKSHQMGSPTPPDSVDSGTDMDTDSEVETESEQTSFNALKEPVSLWEAQLRSPKAAAGRMWNPPYETTGRAASPEPPAKNVRPAQRRIQAALQISSSNLWSKPASKPNSRPVVGLWGSRLVRPVSIRTRLVTQRPPRKSKRVTFLPDIVESPVPLPNKRDTLGIFQFPWGETSDSAVYQPKFNPALLSAPIFNAKLGASSRQLEPEEYSSSFFDDYDENIEGSEDAESDDDFDETTLWEIASLLKSEDVPSKNSLLPKQRGSSVIDVYDDEGTDFEDSEEEEEEEEERRVVKSPETKLPIMPLALSKAEKVEAKTDSMLWASDMEATFTALNAGLPQPEPQVWQEYIPSTEDVFRSTPRSSETPPVLASTELWAGYELEATNLSASPMWSKNNTHKVMPIVASESNLSSLMWTPDSKQVEMNAMGIYSSNAKRSEFRTTQARPAASAMICAPRSSTASLPSLFSQKLWAPEENFKKETVWTSVSIISQPDIQAPSMWAPITKVSPATIIGLFSLTHPRSSYPTTIHLPAALTKTRTPRASNLPLSELTSSELWSASSSLPSEHHWISESSIRPVSPSIYSPTSSGRSSPDSETSSISGESLKSTSTNASSLWGSIKSASTPTWWDTKGARKTPSPTGEDEMPRNGRFASKLPVAKGLAPVRDSRVLAISDMWEAKAPVALGETPKRSFRRNLINKDVEVIEPVKQSPKKKFQRPVAEKADWDAALAEAIASASAVVTPRKVWTRPVASKAELDATLEETVGKGTSAKVSRYDPAVLHPVFFTTSIVATLADVHPAAIGHVRRVKATPEMWETELEEAISKGTAKTSKLAIQTHVKVQRFDPAVLHPVFFTTSLVSNVVDVHPAAIGHVVRPRAPSMWTAPCEYAAVIEAPIGAMWKKGKVVAAQFEHYKIETKRSSPVARTTGPPTLESAETWQPIQSAAVENRHWIGVAKPSQAELWTAPQVFVDEDSKAMWASKPSDKASSPDTFSHIAISPIKGEYVKKASSLRPAALARLNSNELFSSAPKMGNATHWLHSTSSSRSSTPATSSPVCTPAPAIRVPVPISMARSQTWAPAVAISPEQVKSSMMWEPRPPTLKNAEEATIFSNPHSERWSRKKRSDSGVELEIEELESQQLWARKWTMPESPKHWLEGNAEKVSKVQFRY